jgi:TetR/AcrR family transcriptional regulator, cholesterol catabolism regulator
MSSTRPRSDTKGRKSSQTPRAASPKRREREIVAKAAEIFRRNGYADTSVQDVADAVGILKGSLYYYIDSKEDLLYRVLLEVHEDAHGILDEILAMTDVTPLDRISAYVRRHIEYNVRNLNKIAVYYHDFGLLSAERKADIRAQRRVYEDFLEHLIREAQKAGQVDRNADPRVLAYCMFGTMNWTYTWYRPGGRVSVAELADMVSDFTVRGLSLPPGASANGDERQPRKRTPRTTGATAAPASRARAKAP